MDPLALQMQLRNQHSEYEAMSKDLREWGAEMKRGEDNLKETRPEKTIKKPKKQSSGNKSSKYKGKSTVKQAVPLDYSSWEKFDVDAECAKLDEAEDKAESSDLSDEIDESQREEALCKKEEGNKYVKQQKWTKAITCYTKAIELYAYDPVFYANRALCYLKLEEYQGAESDCTSALTLDKTYVKAYQRRAAAREALNQLTEAHADLLKVFDYESNNKESRLALKKLEKKLESFNVAIKPSSIQQQKSKFTIARQQQKQSKELKLLQSHVVESDNKLKGLDEKTEVEDTKKQPEVKRSKPFIEECKENATKELVSDLWFKKDNVEFINVVKKQPRDISQRPLRRITIQEINLHTPVVETNVVSQPPINSRDECTIKLDDFKVVERKSNNFLKTELDQTKIKSQSTAAIDFEVPVTSVQFATDWRLIKDDNEAKYNYLKRIDPNKIPWIFKESLDCETFPGIIHTLAQSFVENKQPVFDYLIKLSEVKRFSMLVMFMGAQEKKDLKVLFDYMRNIEERNVQDIDSISKKYGVS